LDACDGGDPASDEPGDVVSTAGASMVGAMPARDRFGEWVDALPDAAGEAGPAGAPAVLLGDPVEA
jgi:hypothetical protein